jgi:hypothetical protein
MSIIISSSIGENQLCSLLKPYICFGDIKLNSLPNIKSVCTKSLHNANTIYDTSDPFCKNDKLIIPKNYYKSLIKKITMDINKGNPKGKQIISGVINKEYFNKDNFIKRSNEKIIIL